MAADRDGLLAVVDDVLSWRPMAREVLCDRLAELGHGQRFARCRGTWSRIGVLRALLLIGALEPADLEALGLAAEDRRAALAATRAASLQSITKDVR